MPRTKIDQIQHPDDLDFSDVEVARVLPKWKRNTAALEALFGLDGLPVVESRRATPGGSRTVVFLSYENAWGKSGGIAAVASMLPRELSAAGEKVIRISPFHRALSTLPPLPEKPLQRCEVSFDGRAVNVDIYLLRDRQGQDWYLFGAPGFFEADGGRDRNDPYVYSGEDRAQRDGAESRLLNDALFAARAVPAVLSALRMTANLVVHAQDWEFAAVALTVKEALLDGTLHSASVVLTLHNPYDHWLPEGALARITRRTADHFWPPIGGDRRDTVLGRMIPLTDAPVSTVSRRFAQEFFRDPLQTGHFVRHYQQVLRSQGLVGIDNGLFDLVQPPAPAMQHALQEAAQGNYEPILAEKLKARRQMLLDLEAFQEKFKDRLFGQLDGGDGRPLRDLPDGVPVFLMVGRLDPGQKGFDVFTRFIESAPVGAGRYILSPLSPLAGDPEIGRFLEDMAQVAEARMGEMLLAPFRLSDVYTSLRAGVTWSVWPSLYEPFGGVTEFYLHGTPVIARATGGLAQQVVDYNINPAGASGFLYRERAARDIAGREDEWRLLQRTLEPRRRVEVHLYQLMLIGLTVAITAAIQMYQHMPSAYGRILANLPDMHQRLSWQRSVDQYRAWYDKAG